MWMSLHEVGTTPDCADSMTDEPLDETAPDRTAYAAPSPTSAITSTAKTVVPTSALRSVECFIASKCTRMGRFCPKQRGAATKVHGRYQRQDSGALHWPPTVTDPTALAQIHTNDLSVTSLGRGRKERFAGRPFAAALSTFPRWLAAFALFGVISLQTFEIFEKTILSVAPHLKATRARSNRHLFPLFLRLRQRHGVVPRERQIPLLSVATNRRRCHAEVARDFNGCLSAAFAGKLPVKPAQLGSIESVGNLGAKRSLGIDKSLAPLFLSDRVDRTTAIRQAVRTVGLGEESTFLDAARTERTLLRQHDEHVFLSRRPGLHDARGLVKIHARGLVFDRVRGPSR